MTEQEEKKLIEQLAAIEHERWSDWQKYLHSKCVRQDGGNLVIVRSLVEQWERQIKTPYSELSNKEKESDRVQVWRYWPIVQKQSRISFQEGVEAALKQISVVRETDTVWKLVTIKAVRELLNNTND